MFAVPPDTPVTVPVLVTVATDVLPLLHTPPEVASLSDMVEPAHMIEPPLMDEGSGLTVTTVVAMQLPPNVYVIVVVPELTPETIPDAPTVATAVLLLLHVPPPASVSAVVEPTHTLAAPVIALGDELIVTTTVALHPVANV
jgi:hypothetical protein